MTTFLEWNEKQVLIYRNQKMVIIFIVNNPSRWTMNSAFPEITVLDVKVVSLRDTKIDWYLFNVIYVNAGIFYVIYVIQKKMIVRNKNG